VGEHEAALASQLKELVLVDNRKHDRVDLDLLKDELLSMGITIDGRSDQVEQLTNNSFRKDRALALHSTQILDSLGQHREDGLDHSLVHKSHLTLA